MSHIEGRDTATQLVYVNLSLSEGHTLNKSCNLFIQSNDIFNLLEDSSLFSITNSVK